jgi:DNA replication factor GINS
MYQELYEAWKKERLTKDLQLLSKDFFERVTEYLRRLKESQKMMDNKTMKARLLKQEFENSKRLSSEIITTRFRKMFESFLPDRKPLSMENLTSQEVTVYQRLSEASDLYSKLKRNLLEGRQTEAAASMPNGLPQKILVRFACDVPAIVGVDLRTYGPFKPEDIASLPTENAQALVHQGVAVKVEVEER